MERERESGVGFWVWFEVSPRGNWVIWEDFVVALLVLEASLSTLL